MTYEPGKLREDAARYDRMGERLDTDLMRAHADALEELERVKDELLGVKEYREKNPLGGPAKVFDAMADCIRAGDDYSAVLKEYGFCHEAELAKLKALAEAMALHIEKTYQGPCPVALSNYRADYPKE